MSSLGQSCGLGAEVVFSNCTVKSLHHNFEFLEVCSPNLLNLVVVIGVEISQKNLSRLLKVY